MRKSKKDTRYKLVPLTRGLVTAVSPEDYDAVMENRWYAAVRADGRIVVKNDGVNRKSYALSSFILGVTPPMIVDHWNGHPLDNRRINLRACTQSQNMYNKPKLWRNGRKPFSEYKGVFQAPSKRNLYFARIKVAGKIVHLGCFDNEEAAARKLVG